MSVTMALQHSKTGYQYKVNVLYTTDIHCGGYYTTRNVVNMMEKLSVKLPRERPRKNGRKVVK
jgi:hypothetical protein